MKGCIYLFLVLCAACVDLAHAGDRKNVLLLMSDDLRPEINSLKEDGDSMYQSIRTPNLDKLAGESLVFTRAYTDMALCSPSRTSMLTSRRPETTRVLDATYWRTVQGGGNFTTMPQHFQENGYTSIGMGKIFHPGAGSNNDDPISWSEPYYHAPNKALYNIANSWKAIQSGRESNYPLPDQQLAENAEQTISRLAPDALSGSTPFFLAVGFYKPHLPFVFPERYLSFYPVANISVADNQYVPNDFPDKAWSNYGELLAYNDITVTGAYNTTLPDWQALDLRRAYYASVTYVDEQIGRVLQSLEDNNLTDSTVVIFCSDHGFQLGEHAEWLKQTNFELATRVPLMIRMPGKTPGIKTSRLVELVDLFPTAVEAAGLAPVPMCEQQSADISVCTEGVSLLPLFDEAAGGTSVAWKNATFSCYDRNRQRFMGYSIRTARYRYTEWVRFGNWTADWNSIQGIEFYDHENDPGENINLAGTQYEPAYDSIMALLSQQLRAGWRAALP